MIYLSKKLDATGRNYEANRIKRKAYELKEALRKFGGGYVKF